MHMSKDHAHFSGRNEDNESSCIYLETLYKALYPVLTAMDAAASLTIKQFKSLIPKNYVSLNPPHGDGW